MTAKFSAVTNPSQGDTMTAHYNPQAGVDGFLMLHGQLGSIVLEAFSTVDPLSCYFGDHANPDEYLRYAEKFISSLERDSSYFNDSLREKSWPEFIRELVRRTFGPVQLAEGIWIREGAIEQIAETILLFVPHTWKPEEVVSITLPNAPMIQS